MSTERAKAHLAKWGADKKVLEFDVSSATVALAAEALGCEPARIAKTLSFKTPDEKAILIVAAGDVKIDNRKFREYFGFKAKMLSPDEVEPMTGHTVGGVCPFGICEGVMVYLDESLRRFDTVYPAAGGSNTAIELTMDELYEYSLAVSWVDVCKV